MSDMGRTYIGGQLAHAAEHLERARRLYEGAAGQEDFARLNGTQIQLRSARRYVFEAEKALDAHIDSATFRVLREEEASHAQASS
jgi:hypothetical protein